MKSWIAVSLLFSFTLTGCFNTYTIPSVEFRKLQSQEGLAQDRILADKLKQEEIKGLLQRTANQGVTVKSLKNKQIAVDQETRVFVRKRSGRRLQVTPFNFSMHSSQMVSPDRDHLEPLAELSSYEVDLFSTKKTSGVIAVGVGAAVAFIAMIIATSGSKSLAE
jgi:hypothetical protein